MEKLRSLFGFRKGIPYVLLDNEESMFIRAPKSESARITQPVIFVGKTLEESAGSNVYLEGNGEYFVIGGKRYTAKFVFEENLKKQKKDVATQYSCADFLKTDEGEYYF